MVDDYVNELVEMNISKVIPRSRSVVATLKRRVLGVEAIIVDW